MIEHQFAEQQARIARYKTLEQEVTDPLAASLLHAIVLELEDDLRRLREIDLQQPASGTSSRR